MAQSLSSEIQHLRQQQIEESEAAYHGLVASLTAGETVDPADALGVLEVVGKSEAELEADVARLEERNALKASLAELPRLKKERQQIISQMDKVNGELEKLREAEARLEELRSQSTRLRGRIRKLELIQEKLAQGAPEAIRERHRFIKKNLAAAKRGISELNREIVQQQIGISGLDGKLETLHRCRERKLVLQRRDKHQTILEAKQEELASRQAAIAEWETKLEAIEAEMLSA